MGLAAKLDEAATLQAQPIRWMEGTLFDRLVVAAIDSKAVTYKELLTGAK